MLRSGTPAVLEKPIHTSVRKKAVREDDVLPELRNFSSLYREHSPFIYSVLRRLRVPESAIDDALQEVFLVAYRRRRSFQQDASMRSWLYGITIRVARAKNRKATFRRLFFFPLREDDEALAKESGEDPVEKKEAITLVDKLLKHMPSKQREVFVLSELEGLTAQEIAPVLGCNVNTVYSRLRLARQRFEAAAARQRAEEQRARG